MWRTPAGPVCGDRIDERRGRDGVQARAVASGFPDQTPVKTVWSLTEKKKDKSAHAMESTPTGETHTDDAFPKGDATGQANGRLGDIPIEILVFTLNGSVRSPRRPKDRFETVYLHDNDGRVEWIDRPLLDPRWRFVARGVCRLWRDIIQHPSPSDVAALDACRPFARNSTRWSRKCPKWPTGRIVCLTAVAERIVANSDLWSRDPEAVVDWCRDHAGGATRKQAVAALIASGVPWAFDQVIAHHWPLLSFSDQSKAPWAGRPWTYCPYVSGARPRPIREGTDAAGIGAGTDITRDRPYGWGVEMPTERHDSFALWDLTDSADCNREDGDGEDEGVSHFVCTLLAISIRRGLYDTFCALQRTFGCEMSEYDAVVNAIVGDRPDLVATFLVDAEEIDDEYWCIAAGKPGAACLERLMELGPLPAQWSSDRIADWMREAINHDRPQVLALCDARGIKFDPTAVINRATHDGAVGVLTYMLSRACDLYDSSPETTPPIDLRAIACEAMKQPDCARDRLTIEWLCDVAGYAPRPRSDDFARLVECACDGGRTRTLLHVAERWPLAFVALPPKIIGRSFGCCISEGACQVRDAARLAALLDTHVGPADRDAVAADLDLWGVVVSKFAANFSERCSSYGSAVMALCLLALGERPGARGVEPRESLQVPCACTTDPDMRHPRTKAIIESNGVDPMPDADVEVSRCDACGNPRCGLGGHYDAHDEYDDDEGYDDDEDDDGDFGEDDDDDDDDEDYGPVDHEVVAGNVPGRDDADDNEKQHTDDRRPKDADGRGDGESDDADDIGEPSDHRVSHEDDTQSDGDDDDQGSDGSGGGNDGDGDDDSHDGCDDDNGVPCSDDALAALAPLRRWCPARPVRASDLFPGWAPPARVRAAEDRCRMRFIRWLDARGFLYTVDHDDDDCKGHEPT